MRNRHLIPVAAAAAVAVGAVLSAGPAFAAVTRPVVAKSRLVLTVTPGEKSAPAKRHATLTCGPAGGSHHSARKACAAIGAVNGSLDKLVPAQTMCTMQYDPVTVTATGSWRGSAVRYTHTFSNSCVLGADTGPVFAF